VLVSFTVYANTSDGTPQLLIQDSTDIDWHAKKQLLTKGLTRAKDNLEQHSAQLGRKLLNDVNELKEELQQASPQTYPLEKPLVSKQQTYSYQKNIRPIVNKKCLACHACYDAPCQLKMESASGLQRGASKANVYDGGRLAEQPPTRLGIDAQTPIGWRQLGFFPILNGYKNQQGQTSMSTMQQMLDLAHNNPLPSNKPIPKAIELGLNRNNTCPAPDKFSQYANNTPHGGMPLAFTGLNNEEYQTLSTWLKEGAVTTAPPLVLNQSDQSLIKKWETFLNNKDKRSQLVARYLYEHLFLAHLYFNELNNKKDTTFFKLIRSSTPPDVAIIPIKSIRPNDEPGTPFYYRLQAVSGTIVHKTHIVYAFGEQRIKQYQTLFFKPNWTIGLLPNYSEQAKANPFTTFSDIPAKIRYKFLLNDATFFVRNFIRGPVCRGQIATDVIRDQFWLMFENPADERYTNNPDYQKTVNGLLSIPGLNNKLSDFGSEWLEHKRNRNNYIDKRQQEYNQHFPNGAEISHIWAGSHANNSAFQTIFRHHDSASIVKGWHGDIPLTSWLLDYPLLERTFYELVVGFNVFGNVSHQAQTRLYFDLIRHEGETNFLRFLPANARESVYQHWYQNSGKLATLIKYHALDTTTPSAIKLPANSPYSRLLMRLMDIYPEQTQRDDPLNRCTNNCLQQVASSPAEKANQILQQIASQSAANIHGIHWLPEVSFLRVNLADGRYLAYTLLRNRRHSNVAFMLGESLRYQEELDNLTIMPTLIGSYPNLIFQVELSALNAFVDGIKNTRSQKAFEHVIEQWGVRRMDPNFWEIFHSFSQHMKQHKPLEAGSYDLNRYGHY